MEDVPVPEAEPLAREAAVLRLLIVKQCPVGWEIVDIRYVSIGTVSPPPPPTIPPCEVFLNLIEGTGGAALPGQQ